MIDIIQLVKKVLFTIDVIYYHPVLQGTAIETCIWKMKFSSQFSTLILTLTNIIFIYIPKYHHVCSPLGSATTICTYL